MAEIVVPNPIYSPPDFSFKTTSRQFQPWIKLSVNDSPLPVLHVSSPPINLPFKYKCAPSSCLNVIATLLAAENFTKVRA